MKQTTVLDISSIGEQISKAEGSRMINDHRIQYPDRVAAFNIGRNILEDILAQPGCAGIRFYNALDELSKPTLVYAGIDANDQLISTYTVIGDNGEIQQKAGIIADRLRPPSHLDWGWLLPD